MIKKPALQKEYLVIALSALLLMAVSLGIFIRLSLKEIKNQNQQSLERSSQNIASFISDSFNYTNQINSYIGQQIVNSPRRDINFLNKLFSEAGQIRHKNIDLFSWSSFDWVNDKNFQILNSKIGIRKEPVDMSGREYAKLSREKPWTLQLSFPSIGIPSGILIIPAATGIVDKKGSYLGAISVGFDVSSFASHIGKKIDPNVSYIIFDRKNRIVLKSPQIKFEENNGRPETIKIDEEITEKSGNLSKKITVGEFELNHFQVVEDYGYIVLTGFNKNYLSSQFNLTILPRIIELICLTIFFLLLLYLFEARILMLENEKNLRISLEKINADKDRLISSIAHDIKNQIIAINGLATMALEKKGQKEISENDDLKNIESIAVQSEEMMEFVRDLLDQNQIKQGQFKLSEIKEHFVKSIINDVIVSSRVIANINHVRLISRVEHDSMKISCDEFKMKQILTNLISNAIKYSHKNAEVVISARIFDGDKVCIEIEDKGFGMTKDEIEKYLSGEGKEISKLEVAREKKVDSYGIGMPIVLKLLELHGARIEVNSTKNIGTKISVFFDHKLKKSDEKSELHDFEKSILLVEDNPVNIKITLKILGNNGYKVAFAENGQEALELIDKEKFDLVLMDCEMPVMNGYKTSEIIREGKIFENFKDYKSIPIVALTSFVNDQIREKIKASGMNDIVEKTISKTNLLETIEKYLK